LKRLKGRVKTCMGVLTKIKKKEKWGGGGGKRQTKKADMGKKKKNRHLPCH